MNVFEVLKYALSSLGINKTRTILTMLGVIIGVFSVVLLIALGQGIQNYISDEFEALGSNLVFISPGKADFTDDPAKSLTANKLEEKHEKLIITYARDAVIDTTPYILLGENAEYKTKRYYAEIIAVNEKSLDIVNYKLDLGRNFTSSEVRANAKVAILGPIIVEEFFSNIKDPIGERISLGDETFDVIGTFIEKGSNYDDQIIIPYTTATDIFAVKNFSSIVAKLSTSQPTDLSIKQIELALLRDLKEDDFTVLSQEDLLSSIQSILNVLTLGLGAIAGISLLVGGIGIMNIMLVSVTERTREIGLRKAVGASPSNIAIQFLSEALVLSTLGGTVGLLLGFIGSLIAQNFIRTEIPLYAIILAFGFSVSVGIVFGTYPAIKASKKDPIEALRYE